ncbi:acyl--CoA ligase [Agrobacterium rhizogenes]|nr:acyl--CoA ligase [Rhizobium rhizogenes]
MNQISILDGSWQKFLEQVKNKGQHPALLTVNDNVTFAELRILALTYAGFLRRQKISPGSRCAFWCENSIRMAAAILGSWAQGCVVSLINPGATATTAARCCDLIEAAILFCDDDQCELEKTFHTSMVPLTAVTERGSVDEEPFAADIKDLASIIFTSGSTGHPKGVCQTHSNLVACSENIGRLFELSSRDRIHCPVSWAFDYGWGQFHLCVLQGIPLVLSKRGDVNSFWATMEQHSPSVIAGVPSLYAIINALKAGAGTFAESVRLLTSSGSYIPHDTIKGIRQKFPNASVALNYGLTETYRSTCLPPALLDELPNSVGFAVPGVRIDVVDENGNPAEAGTTGEIIHSGLGVFQQYWAAEDQTLAKKRPFGGPGQLSVFTGDIGYKGPRGELYLSGRRDRMIKSADIIVQPEVIERAVTATGMITAVGVFSRPDRLMGQKVEAAVVMKPGHGDASFTKLQHVITDELGRLHAPRAWHKLTEIPLLPNMKVDYGALQRMFVP